MELIFLYIAHFRNLNELNLNFSFDQQVTYQPNSKLLTIHRKANAIDGFFGPNVANVSGIIGKNSAGKSNILDLICYLCKGGGARIGTDYLMLFKVKHSSRLPAYECFTNVNGVKADYPRFTFNDPQKSVPNLGVVFFSNISDGRSPNFPKDIIDISQNRHLRKNDRKGDYYTQLRFMLSDYFTFSRLEPPKGLLLSVRDNVWSFSVFNDFFRQFDEIPEPVRQHLKRRSHTSGQLAYRFRSRLFLTILSEMISLHHRSKYEDPALEIELADVKNLLNTYLGKDIQLNQAEVIHRHVGDFIAALFQRVAAVGSINAKDIEVLLNFDRFVNDTHAVPFPEKLSGRNYFVIDHFADIQHILWPYAPLFNYPELLDIEWIGISSGHQAFLNLFAQLYGVIRRVSQFEQVLICIDEGDLYLHPQWQKEFLLRLITFIPSVFKKQQIQLLLTTHSPFLVTDLPRQNLVLLDRDQNGQTVVVSQTQSLEKTFGANLYDLYESSFFLADGALGDFALEKIRRAIAIANNPDSGPAEKANALQITELIGEDLIRIKLEKMLGHA